VKKTSELAARHFDEFILDDFFFVNSKTDSDIAAKGDRSWTDFRLKLMDEAGANLVVKAAKDVNPKIKVVIKFPNWYEHFQGLGFDLDKEPKIFDGIYTGTETRDPVISDQYLQQYESYQIIRYFENIKPGGNGGGWVDTYNVRYVDRYAEQLWDTMFAKAREITLFNWIDITEKALPGDRKDWQGLPTSFNYNEIAGAYHPVGEGAPDTPSWATVAGAALRQADAVVGKLGNPSGSRATSPTNPRARTSCTTYIGMIGIPIDLHPEFPTDAKLVLLTEAAKSDPDIVAKIKKQLVDGKSVVITSGLLRALKGKGIEDICETEVTDNKVLARIIRRDGARASARTWAASEEACDPLPRGAVPDQRRLGPRERHRERQRLPDHAHGPVQQGGPLRLDHPGQLPQPLRPAGRRHDGPQGRRDEGFLRQDRRPEPGLALRLRQRRPSWSSRSCPPRPRSRSRSRASTRSCATW
jgi:hypothetical protein